MNGWNRSCEPGGNGAVGSRYRKGGALLAAGSRCDVPSRRNDPMVDEHLKNVRQIIPDEMEEMAQGHYRRRRSADVLHSLEDEEPSLNQVLEAEEEAEEARGL